jgi:hypothetical protein
MANPQGIQKGARSGVRNIRFSFDALTKNETEAIRAEANFTEEQERIFTALGRGLLNDEGIMLSLNLSPRHYYRSKRIVCDKTDRIAREKGYIYALKR